MIAPFFIYPGCRAPTADPWQTILKVHPLNSVRVSSLAINYNSKCSSSYNYVQFGEN